VFALRPEDIGQAPDGDAPATPSSRVSPRPAPPLPGRTLWHHEKFLTLAAGMALALFAQIGLLAHLFSILVPVRSAQTTPAWRWGSRPASASRAARSSAG
jgi:hypothetical protein